MRAFEAPESAEALLGLLREPSPAIRRRLAGLGLGGGGSAEADPRRMPRVARIRRAVEEMRLDEVLFHGFDSLESSLKALLEHGLGPEDPAVRKCLDFLLEAKEGHPLYRRGLSAPAEALEEAGVSGARTIRASLLAQAGLGEEASAREMAGEAMKAFAAAADYEGLEDFARERRGILVLRKGRRLPDYYHLRLLAFSDSWRSEAALGLAARALDRLAALSPLAPVYAEDRGRLVAPGSYLMRDFRPGFSGLDEDGKAAWLLRNEYLARMGLLGRAAVGGAVLAQAGDAGLPAAAAREIGKSYSFMRWGAYTGLALEEDWRRAERKLNDLAFRFLLIRFYGAPGPPPGPRRDSSLRIVRGAEPS